MSGINYICSFNGIALNSLPNVQVYSIDNFGNQRTLNIFPLARRNAAKVASAFYQGRAILVSLYITAASRAQADVSLDSLFQTIQGREGTLIIEQSGTIRQYTATFNKLEKNNSGVGRGFAQPPQGGYADVILEFLCSDSYGYDTTSQTIYNLTNQTAASNNYPYTQGGSAETQVPVLQVQLNTTPGTPTATITVGNSGNGQAISVTRTWAQYDLLIIDSKNKTVQVNGIDTAFSGAFPEFGLGAQTIYVSDTFSSRNYRFVAQVQNRYI